MEFEPQPDSDWDISQGYDPKPCKPQLLNAKKVETIKFGVLDNGFPLKSNVIRTSKYSAWSFLPLNFLHQIVKAANIYFIIICILQMIPPISISAGKPTNLPPLLFVIAVSMVKDFFEDRTRQKSDAEENDNKTQVLDEKTERFKEVQWRDVKIGDVIKVMENDALAADIIITTTASSDNVCYVETKNLDGETNLKPKAAPTETIYLTENDYKGFSVECEGPSDKIYQFQGVLKTSRSKIAVTYDSFALRGCNLRNTPWITGIVTYVGPDTRIMRNSAQSRPKHSNLENQTSKQVLYVFLTMMVFCACSSIYVVLWQVRFRVETNTYLVYYDAS
jgi:magnesium-transporting ATPase (P-type)